MMQVKDVMVKDVVRISQFAKLREALSLMKRHNVKSLVVDRQAAHDAWGIITYTNILKTVIAEDGDIDLLNVYDACAKPALAVTENLAVRYAATLMINHRIKRLLVTRDEELLGFITMDDIMDALLETIE